MLGARHWITGVAALMATRVAVLTAAMGVSAASPECTCRAMGRSFDLGRTVCLSTPNGPRVATCVMVLNNTSWEFSETPCVVSVVPPPSAPIALHGDDSRRPGG